MECCIESWLQAEFETVDFGDERISKRFKILLSGFMKNAQDNISSAFGKWSDIKACYRFLSNSKVTPAKILQPHKEKTLDRIASQEQVLLLHDTTYIDYKNRTKTKDLDYISSTPITKNPVKGLILHNSLAVSNEGIPLGIWGQDFIERKALRGRDITKNISIKKPIEAKESFRWLKAIQEFNKANITKNVVHIADREADIYELYREAIALDEQFLIRARLDRAINKKTRRQVPEIKLFSFFEALPPQGRHTIKIQTQTDKKYRNVTLNLSYAPFHLSPPPNKTANKDGPDLPHLPIWGIMVREDNPPEGVDSISWLLLTNIPIESLKDALEKITWYSYRWNIELFHKILKSGCSIEKAQLRDANNLKKYIAMKSIIAWRLFWITRSFNRDKNETCEAILSSQEWQILYKRFHQGEAPEKPPKIEDIYYWIARLGGYINRKSDGPPGIICMWKGWTRFNHMITDVRAICG